MKKITLIISLLLAISCSDSTNVIMTVDEYNTLVKSTTKEVELEWPVQIQPFEWNCKATLIELKGHQILFTETGSSHGVSSHGGIATMHWPECEKCLNDSTKNNK
jgi:hypothetical protein